MRTFLGPAPPAAKPPLVLLAYLGRAARRPDVRLSAIAREMALVWLWLLAQWEFLGRMSEHPAGAALWFAATTSGPAPAGWLTEARKAVERQAPTEWVRRAARTVSIEVLDAKRGEETTAWTRRSARGAKGRGWIHGVLGEHDPVAAREEAVGRIRVRLAEELRRLGKQPMDALAAKAMAGLLDYHRRAAEQAVLRGKRPERERHKRLEDPMRVPDPLAQFEPEDAAEQAQAERIAKAVVRAFRLPPAQARVVRYITAYPEAHKLTQREIAAGAGVSVRTVEGTYKKLAGDQASLLRIVSRQ